MFEKISRSSVSEDVVEQIKRLISTNKMSIGEKFPNEIELGEMLGVSRPTIREALITLQAEGYIEIKRGKGAFVIDKEEFDRNRFIEWFRNNEYKIQELIEARIAIEPMATSLAAERIKDSELKQLEVIYERTNDSIRKQDLWSIVKGDEDFHESILKASRNELLLFMYRNFIPSLREYRSKAFSPPANPRLAIDAHKRILDALKARDSNRAYEAMLFHLNDSQRDIIGTISKISKDKRG